MKSESFTNALSPKCRHAWNALKDVIQNVLGINRAEPAEVKRLVKTMLDSYHAINASMTLKLHFLHHHLDDFLKQLPTESDQQGERFHQVTMPMEKRYKGKKPDALLAEVCWWSYKISEYEGEGTQAPEDVEGPTVGDMPSKILSDIESDDEPEPQAKKSRPSTSKAPMETD